MAIDLYLNAPPAAPFYLDIDDDEDIRVGTEILSATANVSYSPVVDGKEYCSDHYWETSRGGQVTETYTDTLCDTAPDSESNSCDPQDEDDECTSPILLDLDRNQFHLSGGPVLFDIDADGQLETITWVAPGTRDAFLFLDRNGNGVVDDGSELFGNATLLFSGEHAEHGYEALAEFDLIENGGNQDGLIDDSDSVFADLGVWIDSNANGNHENHESQSLAEAGVLTVGLSYRQSRRTDRHRNEFRYIGRGSIEINGRRRNMWTTDVFFRILS